MLEAPTRATDKAFAELCSRRGTLHLEPTGRDQLALDGAAPRILEPFAEPIAGPIGGRAYTNPAIAFLRFAGAGSARALQGERLTAVDSSARSPLATKSCARWQRLQAPDLGLQELLGLES